MIVTRAKEEGPCGRNPRLMEGEDNLTPGMGNWRFLGVGSAGATTTNLLTSEAHLQDFCRALRRVQSPWNKGVLRDGQLASMFKLSRLRGNATLEERILEYYYYYYYYYSLHSSLP